MFSVNHSKEAQAGGGQSHWSFDQGACATYCIWLRFGPQQDPLIKARVQFFSYCAQALHVRPGLAREVGAVWTGSAEAWRQSLQLVEGRFGAPLLLI